MTLSQNGLNYICENFGDLNLCCVRTGLSWYFITGKGERLDETGGTAMIVSRLASGLAETLTMVSPDRGTFTPFEMDTANGSAVSLEDAKNITYHDEPTEVQWCFIPCSDHPDQATCELYGCYWWNGACHDAAPTCEELNNQTECEAFGCYWYNGACHSVDQPELCYWIDDKGGPAWLDASDVVEIINSYIYGTPPSGYTFIPTVIQASGVIDYYLGFDGDAKTGCDFYLQGNGRIQNLTFPETVDPNTPFDIEYDCHNIGATDIMWGHILDKDTGVEVPGSYWEEEIIADGTKHSIIHFDGITIVFNGRVEVGHVPVGVNMSKRYVVDHVVDIGK